MSKYIRPALIGLVVAIVVAFGLSLLYGALGDHASRLPLILGAILGFFTAYILSNLSGNRAQSAATVTQKAEALQADPPAGKAFLYLYREGLGARLAGLNVSVDGRVVAQLKSPSFTCITIPPGSHTVSAAFGGLPGPQNNPTQVTFQASSGAVVALRMTMKMTALKISIDVMPQADLGAVKHTLAGRTMTQPELAEI